MPVFNKNIDLNFKEYRSYFVKEWGCLALYSYFFVLLQNVVVFVAVHSKYCLLIYDSYEIIEK